MSLRAPASSFQRKTAPTWSGLRTEDRITAIGSIADTPRGSLGSEGNRHAHARLGIHAPFHRLYAVHSVRCHAFAHHRGVSAGIRCRARSVASISVAHATR